MHNKTMKKIFVISLFIFAVTFFVFKQLVHKTYAYQYVYDEKKVSSLKNVDYLAEYEFFNTKQIDISSSKILLNYIKNNYLNEEKSTTNNEIIKNYISDIKLWAVSFDLENDSAKEIIGVADSPFLCGSLMNCFFILDEKEGKYSNITYLLFNKEFYKIRILTNKTHGHYDLLVFSNSKNISDRVLRYNKVK